MASPAAHVDKVARFLTGIGEAVGDPTMPVQQHLLLAFLFVHGETAQSLLSDAMHVAPNSVTRHITALGPGSSAYASDGPGLVENYEDLRNRRAKYVRLTPKGKALIEKVVAKVF